MSCTLLLFSFLFLTLPSIFKFRTFQHSAQAGSYFICIHEWLISAGADGETESNSCRIVWDSTSMFLVSNSIQQNDSHKTLRGLPMVFWWWGRAATYSTASVETHGSRCAIDPQRGEGAQSESESRGNKVAQLERKWKISRTVWRWEEAACTNIINFQKDRCRRHYSKFLWIFCSGQDSKCFLLPKMLSIKAETEL